LADKGTNYYKDKACVMKHSYVIIVPLIMIQLTR